MKIQVVKNQISRQDLKEIMKEYAGDFVKAVVDVQLEIMAVGGEFHSDEEVLLMEQEKSARENTWGVNLWPEKSGEDFIEFDSMINLKPFYGNRTRNVDNVQIQEKIKQIVNKLVKE